jgi:hypothetical protein
MLPLTDLKIACHSRAGGNLNAIVNPTKALRLPVELAMTVFRSLSCI